MAVLKKIKRAIRGEVKLTTAFLEVLRRGRVSLHDRRERSQLANKQDEQVTLAAPYSQMSPAELLVYFRGERKAKFVSVFEEQVSADLINSSNRIVNDHSWSLLGFGE